MKSFIVACLTTATSLGVKFNAYNNFDGIGGFYDGSTMTDMTGNLISQVDSGFDHVAAVNNADADDQMADIKASRDERVGNILEEARIHDLEKRSETENLDVNNFAVDGMVNIFENIAP